MLTDYLLSLSFPWLVFEIVSPYWYYTRFCVHILLISCEEKSASARWSNVVQFGEKTAS